jgi:hypothetical protein
MILLSAMSFLSLNWMLLSLSLKWMLLQVTKA